MSAPDETLLDHLRQQALTTHQRCEKLLAGKQPLSSKEVHALRVASKRLRADWQVLKPLLKDNLAEEANRTLRDTAASLRQARDLKVMAETLQKLAEQARGKDTRRALGDGYQQLFAELPDTAVVAKKTASLRAAFEQDQQRWQALELKIDRENLVSDNREWLVAMRPGKRKKIASQDIDEAEHIKASVRAKVEHAFFYIKRMFGYSKVRYRGLAKNTNRLYVLAGLANLLRSQKYLLA